MTTPDDDLIERVAAALDPVPFNPPVYAAHLPWGQRQDRARDKARRAIEEMRKASDDGHRTRLDFQMMLARFIRRAKAGKDLAGTIQQAEDLLRRKGTLSPFRDAALNPAPAKPSQEGAE